MNTKITILTIAAMTVMLGACNKSEKIEDKSPEYITVSTGIGTMNKLSTSADGSQTFTAGDQISVYVWTGSPDASPAEFVVNNSINTLGDDSKWGAAPQMLWKNLTDKHYFIGIYPKTETNVTDLSKLVHKVNMSKQMGSDILVASELTGKIAQTAPVPLTFNHMMSKVNIELSYRDQWAEEYQSQGGIPDVDKVTIENVTDEATINCLAGTVTAGGNRAIITMPQVEKNLKYSTIIVPQSGIRTVAVTIKGKNYTYTHGEDIKFESGKITTIKLIVGRNQVVTGDITINNWTAGQTIDDGEALD